jgi:hypothetical protein
VHMRAHAARPQVVADTNVCAFKLDSLAKDSADIYAGDPQFCAGCHAALSATSKATPLAEPPGRMLWVCEFCDARNEITVEPSELPTEQSRDYILSPATEAKVDPAADTVVFCVDVSGSMCVTKEVAGRLRLKSSHSLAGFGELGHEDVRPPRNAQTTWVSRLQCMQAAVDEEIQNWRRVPNAAWRLRPDS